MNILKLSIRKDLGVLVQICCLPDESLEPESPKAEELAGMLDVCKLKNASRSGSENEDKLLNGSIPVRLAGTSERSVAL